MSNIISDILEIEKKADDIINKSMEQAKNIEADTESKLLLLKDEAEKRITSAKDTEIKKSNELIKSESERIEKETELKIDKMNAYYSSNKEKILSELFEKVLKA
ncbi:MAG: hypothetical protein J5590_08900 [Clostridia bacterium]|nr:hypothetical protein [Clostridia bacterium]